MEAKITHRFTVGSNVFFNMFDDFKPKDTDEVCLLDKPLFGDNIMRLRFNKKDLFLIYDNGNLIETTKEPIAIGKFLVPEFAKHLNLTIDGLKQLKDLSENMDDKHSYVKMIYDFYIENNGFFLTDKQREQAYQEYKRKRS